MLQIEHKTVEGVLETFNKAIDDLQNIRAAQVEQVKAQEAFIFELNRQEKVAKVQIDAANAEAKKANRVSKRLNKLIA